jgi:AraC family transcriptional regulator
VMTTPTTKASSAGPEIGDSGWTIPARVNSVALPGCRLRRVTEYIHQNLDKDLSLVELAAVVCMSPYHFARLFKGSTGVPPHRFVVRQRIARAGDLLVRQSPSIAQVSRQVGFRTPSHFTTVFRHAVSITPGAYRTAALREDRSDGEGE